MWRWKRKDLVEKQPSVRVLVDGKRGGAVEGWRGKEMEEQVWGRMPEDMLQQVLRRVPIMAQLRFRCVCRKWRVMLADPAFLSVSAPVEAICALSVEAGLGRNVAGLQLPGEQLLREHKLDLCFLPVDVTMLCLLGAHKGLLLLGLNKGLLSDQGGEVFLYVCNPVSRAWRKLPLLQMDVGFDLKGTFVQAGAALKGYQVIVLASSENQMRIFTIASESWCWEVKEWAVSLPGEHQYVVCEEVVYVLSLRRMMLYSFPYLEHKDTVETESVLPLDDEEYPDFKLGQHDGCLILAGAATPFTGFEIWRLDCEKRVWELVSISPDHIFRLSLNGHDPGKCWKLVTSVETLGDFICIEFDIASSFTALLGSGGRCSWTEHILAFHTRLKTWHVWDLPGFTNPLRGVLDRKLVAFELGLDVPI